MNELSTRELTFGRAAEGELIPCTIATRTPVQRGDGMEVLSCAPGDVDLSRAPLPLIVSHDQSRLAVGLIEGIRATGEKVTGMARFASSAEAQAIRADVQAGIHRSVSVGYSRTGIVNQTDDVIEYRWCPVEVSIVSVPADTEAGFFRNRSNESNPMTATQTPAASAPAPASNPAQVNTDDRAAEIAELCTRHGVSHMAADLIRRGVEIADVKETILNAIALRDAASGGHHNTRVERSRPDDRGLVLNTLVARMGGRVDGEVLGRATVLDLAARTLNAAGQRVNYDDHRDAIYTRAFGAMTTSDFPHLLGAAAARVLAQQVEELASPIKSLARKVNRPDFRVLNTVRADSAPDLMKVNEHGEFKHGTIREAANGWALGTFGRILAMTRQAITNDDLGVFQSAIAGFAAAAARLEADLLAQAITSPGNVDGAPVFASGTNQVDKALSAEGLAAAVLALRTQRGLHGGLLSQQPGTLLVPAALEMKALQLVATVAATTTDDVQPFTGIAVAVEPRLDADSATGWYLVARNQIGLEYGYLDGAEGPQLTERAGFEVDGLEVRARLDFGCGWTAPLGWIKSTGTA